MTMGILFRAYANHQQDDLDFAGDDILDICQMASKTYLTVSKTLV